MVNTKTSGRSSGLAARLRGPLGLKLAGLGLVLFMVAVVTVSMIMFVGGFTQTVAVAVKARRAAAWCSTRTPRSRCAGSRSAGSPISSSATTARRSIWH